MGNYTNLKSIIDQYITTNGQGDITGAILNDVLKSIVDSIGADFLFAGVAEPTTDPGSPDQNVFYIAIKGGTYTNFGNVAIPNGITIFKWNGSWSNQILFAGDGGVFDITAYNNNTKYADLTAALGTNGANVPQSLQKGGMSVKFVQSSDNKYVQYFLTKNVWSASKADWEKMNLEEEVSQLDQEMLLLKNGFKDINIVEWLAGGYNASGSVILESVSYIKRAVIDVSALVGRTISIHIAAYDMIYCGFKDAKGNVLETLQTSESVSAFRQIVIPTSATQMFISTDETYIPTTDVWVRYNNFAELDDEGYITPNSINSQLPSIGKDLISSYGPNNRYIKQNSATETGSASGYTYAISDNVMGGNTYEFVSYDVAVPTSSDNIIRFLDKNGKLCSWSNQYTLVSSGALNGKGYNIFRIVAPLYSVKAEFNFYIVHTEIVYIKRVYAVGDLETILWLGIDNNNFTPQSFKKLGDTLVFAPYFADVISKPVSFANKSVVAFGDSVTAGFTSSSTRTDNPYIKILCDKVGATLDNRAVAGSTFVHRQSSDIVDKILAYTGSADIIWVAGGTNDFNKNLPIGNWGDTGNNTLYGAVLNICEFFKNNHPNAYIIFLTPIPYTNEAKNSVAGFTILDYYRKAIYEVVTYYGYSIINGKNLGIPNAESDWATTMTTDGLHPTERGHNLMAQSISGKLF